MNRFGVKSMENKTDTMWHQLPVEEVVQFLGANLSTGLSAEEVRKRQKESGPNRVTARRGTPAWIKFLQQFNQPLVYILLLSVILGVVLINAVVGFLQKTKAEKAIEALAETFVPLMKQAEADLEQMAGSLRKSTGLNVSAVVSDGKPFEVICQTARTLGADLIVLTTHGYTGLKNVWLGSTAERVVRHAPCPVLAVRELNRK